MRDLVLSCALLILGCLLGNWLVSIKARWQGGAKLPLWLVRVHVFVFTIPPLAWCVSLLPPLNDVNSPIVLGIGGDAYGLELDFYPAAALVFAITGVLGAVVALWAVGRPRSRLRHSGRTLNEDITYRLAVGAAVAAALKFALFYSAFGWQHLIASEMNRFDYHGTALLQRIADGRLMAVSTLLLGSILLVAAAQTSRNGVIAFGVIINVIPLFCLASRSTALLIIPYLLLILWKRSLWWLGSVPALAVCITIYMHPLLLRAHGGTGLLPAIEVLWEVAVGNSEVLRLEVVRMLMNVGQGFPVLVEAMASADAGASILSGTPEGYLVRSFSPLPSMLDGFRTDYLAHAPRINFYTPFSMIAELSAVSVFLVPLVFSFALAVVLILLNRCSLNGWLMPAAMLVFSGYCSSVVMAQQYNTRQASRFFYYGTIVAICWIGCASFGTNRANQSCCNGVRRSRAKSTAATNVSLPSRRLGRGRDF